MIIAGVAYAILSVGSIRKETLSSSSVSEARGS
jgi:hypothetical protein